MESAKVRRPLRHLEFLQMTGKIIFLKATGIGAFSFMLLYLTDTHVNSWHIIPLLEIANEKLFQHLKTKLQQKIP